MELVSILYQLHKGEWKPVDCASRYLLLAEKNYATIELEMLAVSWGMNRMDLYLHGLPHFGVETDRWVRGFLKLPARQTLKYFNFTERGIIFDEMKLKVT